MKKSLCAGTLILIASFPLLSCDNAGSAHQQDEKDNVTPPETDEGGVTVSKYDPNATAPQTFQASGTSAIADAAVTVQPGSLSVDLAVTIEEGDPIVAESADANLGLGSTTIEAAGPAVAITASQLIDATKPFTLALPIESGAALTQGDKGNITVVYKVAKGKDNGGISIGVFPTAEITVEGNIAKVNTTWFGVYQVARSSAPITELKEVRTETPLTVKSKTTELSGRWQMPCEANTKEEPDGTQSTDWERQYLTFSHDRVNIKVTLFNEDGCKTPNLSIEFGATYGLTGPSAKVSGASQLDLTVTRGLVTILNPEVLPHVNDPKRPFCGFTDWKVNEPRAISDFKVCESNDKPQSPEHCNDGPPAFNQTYYTVYAVQGNQLQLGKDEAPNCGATQATRSAALDDLIFTKAE